MIELAAALVLVGWYLLGCGILALIDESEELLNWVNNAPHPFVRYIAIMLWPMIVAMYRNPKLADKIINFLVERINK